MKVNREVKIPMTPNFIMVDGQSVAIQEFTNQDLYKIGKLWTKDLVEKAEKRRTPNAN